MANDLENSIRSAAEKIAAYVDNIATMTVETKYVKIDAKGDTDFTQAKPIARTVLRIDGDSEAILPVRVGEGGAAGGGRRLAGSAPAKRGHGHRLPRPAAGCPDWDVEIYPSLIIDREYWIIYRPPQS